MGTLLPKCECGKIAQRGETSCGSCLEKKSAAATGEHDIREARAHLRALLCGAVGADTGNGIAEALEDLIDAKIAQAIR